MGCDIHLFMEWQCPETEKWVPIVAYWTLYECNGRDYPLFGALAWVRGDGYDKTIEDRGLPADVSFPVLVEWEAMKEDAHSMGYYTIGELEELLDQIQEVDPGEPAIQSLAGILGGMRRWSEWTDDRAKDMRIVFWFDS